MNPFKWFVILGKATVYMEKIRLGMYKTRISPKVSDIRNGGTKYLLFGCFEGVVFLKAYMDEDSYILGT